MEAEFGEHITPARAIKQILDSYPFSVGLFRELLQNSDDARATEQIFVLDHRRHGHDHLIDPYLAKCQGPALLAYNDAVFEDPDWVAIQEISNSSKKADTSKIGKYGLGFRSTYHVTDHPQILSGSTLAVFDPLYAFNEKGGRRVSLQDNAVNISGHLSSMEACLPVLTTSLDGTIIRLPLRTEERYEGLGSIVTPDVIKELFRDFVRDELKIVLLFLKNIRSVVLREVDDEGSREIASVKIERGEERPLEDTSGFGIASVLFSQVTTMIEDVQHTCGWNIIKYHDDQERIVSELSRRLDIDARGTLRSKKLQPDVALAFPIDSLNDSTRGRLFTFLPLPIYTAFPCHIHGLFALTPDRQHLVNAEETGLPEGSEHRHLIEWNRVLFDIVVPLAWTCALQHLVFEQLTDDVFALWPSEQPKDPQGDVAYWANVPNFLAEASRGVPIWPRHRISSSELGGLTTSGPDELWSGEPHTHLANVLTIARGANRAVLDALAAAGVEVVAIPKYIQQILVAGPDAPSTLLPSTAWKKLSERPMFVKALTSNGLDTVLDYLASGQDPSYLLGLPVFTTRNDTHVTLVHASEGTRRTLVPAGDELFSQIDEHAILLRLMPSSVARLLLTKGPSLLNVAKLDASRVVAYLTGLSPNNDPSSGLKDHNNHLTWLLTFWLWLPSCTFKSNVIKNTSVSTLHVVPAWHGGYLRLCDTIFIHPGENDLAEALSLSGYRLIHEALSGNSATMLQQEGGVHTSVVMQDLLQHGPSSPIILNPVHGSALRDHVISLLSKLRSKKLPGPAPAKRLRALPIYEIMRAESGNVDYEWCSLPENSAVISVQPAITLVPTIPATAFVRDLSTIIASHLGVVHDKGRPQGQSEITRLAIQHLPHQDKIFQANLLEYIVQHRTSLPHGIVDPLRRTCFVQSSANDLRAPMDLLDPECAIAIHLYDKDNYRLPARDDQVLGQIVTSLRILTLLRSTFTNDIIHECIESIQDQSKETYVRVERACQLIELVRSHQYKCSGLVAKPSWTRWLPTADGQLTSADQCFDPGLHSAFLFDAVTPVLARTMSAHLRKIVGLTSPPNNAIIIQQLDATLNRMSHDAFQRLSMIYTELGKRLSKDEVSVEELRLLSNAVKDRAWIPIEPGIVLDNKRAAFSVPFLDVQGLPFRAVPATFASSPGVSQLLSRLGCADVLPAVALLEELEHLSGQLDSTQLDVVVNLLRALGNSRMDSENLRKLQVPDRHAIMRPHHEVYYNDHGHRATQVEVPPGNHATHPRIDLELAQFLQLRFLSTIAQLTDADDFDEDDMEEQLTTRISNVLRQYTPEQSFLEFVANAIDAGATKVELVLDDTSHHVEGDLITSKMGQFQGPSLVIYNDAMFKDQDWKGIRKVGRGGKAGQSNTIGRFGLGALSMFHFTEVATVVSNNHVMFIDPSRQHITTQKNRASQRLSLHTAAEVYIDQLRPLDGLFGFDPSSGHFNGTLFRLPLRTHEQANNSDMTNTRPIIGDLIKDVFSRRAEECLLFTPLKSLTSHMRDHRGHMTRIWSRSALRHEIATSSSFRQQHIRVTHETTSSTSTGERTELSTTHSLSKRWTVVTTQIARPKNIDETLADRHRLPNQLQVGVATTDRHRLPSTMFAAMPLPISAPLPVCINASFILADDRRSIRLDETNVGNPESDFNRWLLKEAVPPVYYNLLSCLPAAQVFDWWPRSKSKTDPYAGPVIDGFYRGLAQCNEQICVDVTNERTSSNTAVFMGPEPRSVHRVFTSILKPRGLVDLPSDIQVKVSKLGIPRLDPDRTRSYILSLANVFTNAFASQSITVNDVQHFLEYLEPNRLVDLPLLPLADNTLTTFTKEKNLTFIPMESGDRPWPFLPAHRFVHPDMRLRPYLKDHAQAFRLALLSGTALSQLIRDRIPDGPSRNLSPDDAEWARKIWAVIETLPEPKGDHVDIETLPLVPTADRIRHISLRSCTSESSTVLVSPSASEHWLRPFMESLGASFIEPEGMAPELKSRLGRHAQFDIFTASNFLRSKGAPAVDAAVTRLSPTNQTRLAEWIVLQTTQRARTVKDKKNLNIGALKSLPIWACFNSATGHSMKALANIEMLPDGMPVHVAHHFLPPTDLIACSAAMQSVGKVPMTYVQLRNKFSLPTTLEDALVPSYKNLLRILIAHRPLDPRPPLVPNRQGVMCPPSDLFSSQVPVFAAAFVNQPHRFVHDRFLDFEEELEVYKFRHIVNFESFQIAAQAISEDTADDIMARAQVLYDWYSARLPTEMAGSFVGLWRLLDHLRFIPVNSQRRRGVSWGDEYAEGFEANTLCSPAQVLRPEYESVAWSQRALFATGPSQSLLVTDLNLGVPSPQEVVGHLIVLATKIAPDRSRDGILLLDLRRTYAWLSENQDRAGPCLLAHATQKIWLNVEDPDNDRWEWHSASQLLFNGLDEKDRFEVREWLSGFKHLLLRSGAREIHKPTKPVVRLTTEEVQYRAVRSTANNLRINQKLTDLILISHDGQEFHAHRFWMTLASDFFRDAFVGHERWAESSSDASPANPIRMPVEHSAEALQVCLDYVYLRTIPDDLELEPLVDVVKLAHYWNLQDLFKQSQILLVDAVSLGTWEYIEEECRPIDATLVIEACREFERKNRHQLS